MTLIPSNSFIDFQQIVCSSLPNECSTKQHIIKGSRLQRILAPVESVEEDWRNTQRQMLKNKIYCSLYWYLLTKEQLRTNGFPRWTNRYKNCVSIELNYFDKQSGKKTYAECGDLERKCARCGKDYNLDRNGKVVKAACIYHPIPIKYIGPNVPKYNCCGEEIGAKGCTQACSHVSDTRLESTLREFKQTETPQSSLDPRTGNVYALDCESVYTVCGPEVARITLVDIFGETVLDCTFRPRNTIVDYNTRFSGLTRERVLGSRLRLSDAHAFLSHFINSETILIGHGLDNDLKALGVVHNKIVDTSILYPHWKGSPYKYGLKLLTKHILNRDIQQGSMGHDSREDAIATMELVLHKLGFGC
uniref:Exonuclease domain-containing protein n=1 Tax=Heterorhabditis bacteriophora TaxID=37862 RepID=A0A1I7X3P9_HETBA